MVALRNLRLDCNRVVECEVLWTCEGEPLEHLCSGAKVAFQNKLLRLVKLRSGGAARSGLVGPKLRAERFMAFAQRLRRRHAVDHGGGEWYVRAIGSALAALFSP